MTSMTQMVGITGIITMTDLFFRIAERALGLAPTIQPMIAPLFAPMPYTDNEEMLDILETEEQDDQSSVTATATPTTLENNTHLEPDSQPVASSNASKEASASQRSDIPPVIPVERHVTTYPEIHQPFAQTRVSTSEQTGSAQPHHEMPVKNAIDPIDDGTHHVFLVIERAGDTQEERPGIPVLLTRVQPLPAMLPSSPFTGQKAPRSTEVVIHRQHEPCHHDARGSRDDFSRASQTEQHMGEMLPESVQAIQATPAVHVTIGRIEVRANPVSALEARPQRQHAVPKAMSLDEYLRQSEKGGL